MSETNYSQLRVWRDELDTVAVPLANAPLVEQLRMAFEAATGWVLDRAETVAQIRQRRELGLSDLDSTAPLEIVDMSAGLEPRQHAQNRQRCDRLAAVLSELLRELAEVRAEVRKTHMQMAAAGNLSLRREQLIRWGESIQHYVQLATERHGFSGAAIYLLTDDAQSLDRRFACGCAAIPHAERSRRLTDAPADVEAMAGHAITLTRVAEIKRWRAPIACRATVCLPLSSLSNVLGTIWFFSAKRRRLSDSVVNQLELFAGRIASEIECANLARHVVRAVRSIDA